MAPERDEPDTPKAHPESHHFSLFGLSKLWIAVISSALWMVVSSGLILLNKSLLTLGFTYPMALSGLGMFFSSIGGYLCCKVFKVVEAKRVVTPYFYATRILPVGLCMALTLYFGNLVYLYLGVSLIQMLKAFTPIVTMLALFLARLEVPTTRLIISVCCIAFGTSLASLGSLDATLVGVTIMLSSESFEAIRLVLTQLLLTGLKFNPIEGLMYLAPACTFWLALGSLVLESRDMARSNAAALVGRYPLQFLAAASMGFAVNSLSYIVIQTASSLTLKVLGIVKNAVVVWLGMALYTETVTPLQGAGYGLSMLAFVWYQQIKMQQLGGSAPPQGKGGGAGRVGGDVPSSDVEAAEGDALLGSARSKAGAL